MLKIGGESEGRRAKEVQEEYIKLQEKNEQLKKERHETWTQCETLASQIRSLEGAKDTGELESQLSSAMQENKRLQEQNVKFREIILSKSSSDAQIVDESTIIQKFTGLRDQIQRLVLKFYRCDRRPRRPAVNGKSWSKDQENFFQFWKDGLSENQLKRRTREKMFDLLASEILCRPLYGE